MTMMQLAAPIVWGPAAGQTIMSTASYSLDDSNDSASGTIIAPKTGTINRISVQCNARTGNPPAYKVGLASCASTGEPNVPINWLATPEEYNFTSTGIHWITLTNPVAVTKGDCFAICVIPSTTAPDASNYVSIRFGQATLGETDSVPGAAYSTNHAISWLPATAQPNMAIAYQGEDSFYGNAEAVEQIGFQADTTPDEVGAKFTVPVALRCNGVSIQFDRGSNTSTPVTITLYDSADNVLGQIEIAANAGRETSYCQYNLYFSSDINLSVEQPYRLSIKHTGTLYDLTVIKLSASSPGSLARSLCEGARWQWTERTDAGAWSDTAESCPLFGLLIDQIDLEDV